VVTGLGSAEREYQVYVEYRDRAGTRRWRACAGVAGRDGAAGEDPPVDVVNAQDVGGKKTVYDEYADAEVQRERRAGAVPAGGGERDGCRAGLRGYGDG